MKSPKVLIIDDDVNVKTALYRCLDRKGYSVSTASTKKEALAVCQSSNNFQLALIDLRLPDGNGIELMSALKKFQPQIKSIILTGHGSIEDAVSATQNGAFHFITKPFNLDEVIGLCEKALDHGKLEEENQQLRSALHNKYQFDNIIGQSEAITDVLSLVERVSDSDSTILVTGESGTGKELIAKALHYNSSRATKPFIPINCGAIPAELLESELFGHVKGAFTGAISNRPGRFELANSGTIFLDEIGDMSPQLQVKLLRVLQERTFEPVGSTKTLQTDVRIIAATNVDLEEAVRKGNFREDLYYRLDVIPIKIPPLRDRKSDVILLLHHFLKQNSSSKKTNITGVQPEALEVLNNYQWPGNIRELENLVERVSILKGEGLIGLEDLPAKYLNKKSFSTNPDEINIPDTGLDFNNAINIYENSLILKALEKTGWNRNQAAILLKLNRTTLVEKIKKKGLSQLDA